MMFLIGGVPKGIITPGKPTYYLGYIEKQYSESEITSEMITDIFKMRDTKGKRVLSWELAKNLENYDEITTEEECMKLKYILR